MKRTKLFLFTALIVALICIPLYSVSADVGPKPQMHFYFKQGFEGQSITITNGVLYECDQPDCGDAQPLEELGPQGFQCDEISCYALAYGFSDYHQLEIKFTDGKTRQSNIFETAGFNAVYDVTIQQNDLVVKPRLLNFYSANTYLFLCGCCLCILVLGMAIIAILVVMIARRK